MHVTDQVLAIFSAANGGLDDIEVSAVAKFEEEYLAFMNTRHGALYKKVDEAKDIPKEVEEELKAALEEFKKTFTA